MYQQRVQAITTPSPENDDVAWNKVLPGVDQLQEFYEFSLLLGTYITMPARSLCPCREPFSQVDCCIV